MRVLVTGGYGFIGSYVVETLHREGHQIVILDNLSTGCSNQVDVPHQSHIVDIESRDCD